MKKNYRKQNFKQKVSQPHQLLSFIAPVIIAITLSSISSHAAYDPNYDQPNSDQNIEIAEHDCIAASEKLLEAVIKRDSNLAQETINEHANTKRANDHTVLAIAISKNNLNSVVILILHSADTSLANNQKKIILKRATPAMKKIIDDSIKQRATIVQELDLQDWEIDTVSLSHILTNFIIPPLVDIICAYVNPYYTDEKPLYNAIQHYIENNKKRTPTPKPTSNRKKSVLRALSLNRQRNLQQPASRDH